MIDLLLTRPLAQAQSFAARAVAACSGRVRPIIWPLIRIEDEPVALALDGVQALLFTSSNAVQAFARLSDRRDLPALCVGDVSAAAARAVGLTASSAQGDVGALARLAAAAYLPGAGAYMHLRGHDMAGDLAGALRAEGIHVREAVVYAARPAMTVPDMAATALTGRQPKIVTIFSPRTARLFAGFAGQAADTGAAWALQEAVAVAISRAAADPLTDLGFAGLMVAARPDSDAMCSALTRIVGDPGAPAHR
ncbi:MAG: uroporphyrinogen-III synthase [Pseudomonadota bacterium]